MKNMKRSLRRHDRKRLKKKCGCYWGGHAGSSDKALGQVVATLRSCSYWMCGHQRKHHGLRVQEKRALSIRLSGQNESLTLKPAAT